MPTTDPIDRLVREEYTGRNRCWPCTAVNAVLVAVGAAVVAVVSPLAAVATLTVGGIAIWLRGYVVPYTPRFAPRLVAALGVEALFHGDERRSPSPGAGDRHRGRERDRDRIPGDGRGDRTGHDDTAAYGLVPDVDEERRAAIAGALVESGVLRAEGDRFVLDPDVEAAWWERMATLRDRPDRALAAALADGLPWAGSVTAVGADDRREFRIDRGDAGADDAGRDGIAGSAWVSRPAAVGSAAAVEALGSRGVLDPADRALAADAFRLFLDRCPVCEADLVEEPVGSCCGGVFHEAGDPYQVRVCPDCDAPVATLE